MNIEKEFEPLLRSHSTELGATPHDMLQSLALSSDRGEIDRCFDACVVDTAMTLWITEPWCALDRAGSQASVQAISVRLTHVLEVGRIVYDDDSDFDRVKFFTAGVLRRSGDPVGRKVAHDADLPSRTLYGVMYSSGEIQIST